MEYGAKVPQSQRQRYLDRIVDEYLRLCSTEKEAFEKVILLRTDVNKKAIKIQIELIFILKLHTYIHEHS